MIHKKLIGVSCLFLLFNANVGAAAPPEKPHHRTKIIDIPADLPPPATAAEEEKQQPFFAMPSTGNEAMERLLELEERVDKLEKKVNLMEKGQQ